MLDFTPLGLAILISLFLLWNLELVATLKNLAAYPAKVPPELLGIIDEPGLERTKAYGAANARLHLIQQSTSLLVLLAFWIAGGFQWLDAFARSMFPDPLLSGVSFLALLFLAQSVIALPFDLISTFRIEKEFGFNRTNPATFVMDRVKGTLLAALIGLPLTWLVLWIFSNVGHAWFWAWAVVALFQVVLMFVAPTWIMPLFNKFTPMADGPLKDAIRSLGDRCGFPLEGVSVMDGSKRSTKANAFFTGFGKHRKIALFDTLIEKSSRDEILGVLAHEIGHFRKGHIRQRLLIGLLQMAVIFFLLGLAVKADGAFSKALFEAFGVRQPSPHVGIVLFSILMEPVGRVLGVPSHAWSRRHEFEADAYAVAATGDGTPLASALKKLTADQLSHPCPSKLRVWLDYSHPPLIQRISAINALSSAGANLKG